MDRKFVAVAAILLVLSVSVIAPLAMAKGDGREEHREFKGEGARGFERGEGIRVRDFDRDRWHEGSWGGYYGGYGGYYPSYTYVQPVAYPVYVPANFGGDQGACYQACVNSGQYSPAECGQWCYYA